MLERLNKRRETQWGRAVGCDIHIYTETLNIDTGVWTSCDIHSRNKEGDLFRQEWYQGRYYPLFMLLAYGVRGDVPWGRELTGFPDNASRDAEEEYKEWDVDAHSASHMTLQELIIFCTKIQIDYKPSQDSKDALVDFLKAWQEFMDNHVNWIKWNTVKLGSSDEYPTNKIWEEHARIVYWFDN